ncbi:MAG: cadherin-like domain-containing protein, partial [Gammaproteobacteria bacterium]|nr:cadherin-like domain-containing protein [Gammaproteobacteria bacterium]
MAKNNRSKSLSSRLDIELMEPRLLLSADLLGLAGLPGVDVKQEEAPWSNENDLDTSLSDLSAIPEAADQNEISSDNQAANEAGIADLAGSSSTQLVFVDTTVPDYNQLIDGILEDKDEQNLMIYLLNDNSDGVGQISNILSQHTDVDALHLISHGSPGSLQLGDSVLNTTNVSAYSDELTQWGNSLTVGADLLIYGCDFAANDQGQFLIDAISNLSGADVAASIDQTGHAASGGDWDLEYSLGEISTEVAVSVAEQNSWSNVLATFTVNSNLDTIDNNLGDSLAQDVSGDTTLRAAIMEANALGGSHTIILGADTYTLSLTGIGEDLGFTGDLDINSSLSIIGVSSSTTIIDGFNSDRIFDVQDGNHVVSLENLKIQNGNSGGGFGGGMRVQYVANQPDVTLNNTWFFDNDAGTGGRAGAIFNHGDLTITNSLIEGNNAGEGGGVWTEWVGVLDMTNVTIDGNSATVGDGGGLFVQDGTATLTQVTISDNTAAGTGGGIITDSPTSNTTINNSLIEGNTAHNGGGISSGGTLTMTNITVSGNTATNVAGGLYSHAGTTITNSTFTLNDANDGGGIRVPSGTISVLNTISAGNTSMSGHNDVLGTFTSLGHNLIGDRTGSASFTDGVNGDQVGTNASPLDPMLGVLADNDGPTQTHALLGGSTALNAGTADGGSPDDQRGSIRDATPDIGAYEEVGSASFASLNAIQDSYIDTGNSSANYGSAGFLVVDRSGANEGDQQALLEFDLGSIAAGSTINGAYLVMEATGTTGAFPVYAYEITQAWDEATVTWDTAPTYNNSSITKLSLTGIGEHSWEITSLVQSWLDIPANNYGILLGSEELGTTTFTYDSREGTNVPQLVINYTNLNNAPLALDDSYGTNENTDLVVGVGSDLLDNDSDADGDTLTAEVTDGPDNGMLVFDPVGLGTETNLTNVGAFDHHGRWSLDGSKIAFTTERGAGGDRDIYVMNADGTGVTALTTDGTFTDEQPVWSPDGSMLAITSNRDGDNEIYIIDATNGSVIRQLTTDAGADQRPTWSPDGSQIAWTSDRDGDFSIWVANADGSGVPTKLTTAVGDDTQPVWSPDGSKILFVSMRDGNENIYVMDADGSNETQLTSDASSDRVGAWSPDGSKIFFTSNRSGDFDIWVMDTDGSNQRLVEATAGDEYWTEVSADGTKLLTMCGFEIYEIPLQFDGTFTYVPDANYSGADNFSYVANDGTENSNVAIASITITSVDDPINVNTTGNTVTFTEDAGATTALFSAGIDTIEIGDTISELVLSLANVEAGDTLLFGATSIDLNTNGATGPDAAGFTYTVSSAGASPVVTISHAGTDDATVNAMLNSLLFNNTSNNDPTTTARTVTLTSVTDSGSGLTPDGTVATVNVTPTNDAPTANIVPAGFGVDEDDGYRVLWGFSVSDPDAGSNELEVTLSVNDGLIRLGNVTGLTFTTGSNESASMTFTGTLTDLNTALGTLEYQPDPNYAGTDTLSLTVDDQGNSGGGALIDTNTVDIVVSPINDAPTTTPVTLAPIGEDSGVRTITQAELLANASDIEGDGMTAIGLSISAGAGTLVDNGDGTWDYTPALNDETAVSFSYTISDGSDNTAASANLNITPVNDAPSATNTSQGWLYNEGVPVLNLLDIVVTDPDSGDTITVVLTLADTSTGSLSANDGASYDGVTGIWTVSDTVVNVNTALANLVFNPNTDNDINTSIAVHIEDAAGAGPADSNIVLDVTPFNDAPTATNLNQSLTYNEGDGVVTIADIVVTDVDTVENITATLTLIDTSTGSLSANDGASYDGLTGIWTITNTVDNVNTALANVVFNPNASNEVDTSITTHIEDAAGTGPVDGSIILDVTAANVAPTTTPVVLTPIAEDSGVRVITQAELLLNANDDDGDTLTAASLAISSGSGTLVDNGDGTWNYTPALNDASSVSFSYTISDGTAAPIAASASLDITPVNDAPTTTPVVLTPIAEDSGVRLITQAELLANAND